MLGNLLENNTIKLFEGINNVSIDDVWSEASQFSNIRQIGTVKYTYGRF